MSILTKYLIRALCLIIITQYIYSQEKKLSYTATHLTHPLIQQVLLDFIAQDTRPLEQTIHSLKSFSRINKAWFCIVHDIDQPQKSIGFKEHIQNEKEYRVTSTTAPSTYLFTQKIFDAFCQKLPKHFPVSQTLGCCEWVQKWQTIGAFKLLLKNVKKQYLPLVDKPRIDNWLENLLHRKNLRSDRQRAVLLLIPCVTPDLDNDYGCDFIAAASKKGFDSAIRLLIQNGCSTNRSHTSKPSPLLIACSEYHYCTVELLLKNQPYHFANVRWQDENPLHFACEKNYTQIAQLLLKYQVRINQKDGQGNTPLHYAAKNGNTELVKVLLNHKADPTVKNSMGRSPLFEAFYHQHPKIVKLLMGHRSS